MQTLHSDFLAVLTRPYAHLAYCLRLESMAGQKWFLTSYDFAIAIGSELYLPGLSPMAVELQQGTQIASGGIEGAFNLNPSVLNETVFLTGVLNGAIGRFFVINPFDPPATLAESPPRFLEFPAVRIHSVSLTDSAWRLDYVDVANRLSRRIGIETSKYCRAIFGDSQCGINLAAYTSSMQTVLAGSSRGQILFNSNYSNNYFAGGRVLFQSGQNSNVSRGIINSTNQSLSLSEWLPFAPASGDIFVLIRGCERTKSACISYGNIQNFRGESAIPGQIGYAGGR